MVVNSCFEGLLSTLRKYGGDKSQTEQGGETGEEMVEDRKITDLPVVRE